MVNRYHLCQMAAKVTRRLHFLSTNTTDAINDALVQLAAADRDPILATKYSPKAQFDDSPDAPALKTNGVARAGAALRTYL